MKLPARRLSVLAGLVLMLSAAPGAADDRFKEVVALQNRAQAGLPQALQQSLRDQLASIEIAAQLDRPRLVAVLYQRLGRALEDDGRIQRALTAYESGFKALSGDRSTTVAADLESITTVPKGHSGGPATAPADLYSEAVAGDLHAAEADPALAVNLLLAIGNAYLQQPQPGPARNAYERALRRPEIASMPRLRAYALANLGEVMRRTGETDDAARTLSEALSLLRRTAPPADRRRALVLMAGIHRDTGRSQEALAAYEEALPLYDEAGDRRGKGRALAGLGLLHLRQQRDADAARAFEQSVALGEQSGDRESLWHAYWGLGQARRRTGDLDAAATALEQSLSIIQDRQEELATDEGKVTLLDSASQAFDELLALQLTRAAKDPRRYRDALDVAERARARAMYDLIGARSLWRRRIDCSPRRLTGVTPDVIRSLPAVNAAPSVESYPDGDDPPPMVQMAPAVRSRPRPSPAQMASGVPSGAAGADSGPLDPRCAAGAGAGKVEAPPLSRLVFHTLDDRVVVFAVPRSGSLQVHVQMIPREAVAERVRRLRDALEVDGAGRGVAAPAAAASEERDHRALLRRLYDDFVAPVADAFPSGEPVVVEPHGALWLVPFAALLAPDGAWLADRWPLLYAPSSQVLDDIRAEPPFQRPADIKALVVGNPLPPRVDAQDDLFRGLRATFQPLPGAEEEARTIAALLPATQARLLTGQDATLDAVTGGVRSSTLIHLASHALASANAPLESFVMLAPSPGNDGRLTARGVLDLGLAADLVTLSACQTGLGQLSGDGVIGLSRSFLARGARSVLVSQWSVHDGATSALMRAFYASYLPGDVDKASALQSAMKLVRAQPGFEHPKFWAPFMMVGAEQ